MLKDYRETINKNSPLIRLLSPGGAPDSYWATTGFVGAAGAKTPTLDTVWTADVKTLTPSQPVTLTWDNGEGLLFKRVVAIDDKYHVHGHRLGHEQGRVARDGPALRDGAAPRQAPRRRAIRCCTRASSA